MLATGLALLGAFGNMLNVGDWGWLIGSATGALVYLGLNRSGARLPAVSRA